MQGSIQSTPKASPQGIIQQQYHQPVSLARAIHLLTVFVTDVVVHLLPTSIFNIIVVGSHENESVLISY